MKIENRYFKITGGAILKAKKRFLAKVDAATAARNEVKKEFGAKGTYGSEDGVFGLVFDTPPPKWRPVPHQENVYKPPLGKEGKVISDRLKTLTMPTAGHFHREVQNGQGGRGWIEFSDCGGSVFYMGYETHSGILVLTVPICEEGGAWTPPDEHCIPLKTSEYWQLKEAAEEAKEVQ